MKEQPDINREFTGSDDPFTAEQVGNLLKSTEFADVQKNRIKLIGDNAVNPGTIAQQKMRELFMSTELIKHTKNGDLLANILKCRIAGYPHKKIAKTLMKSERDLPTLSSLAKAITFVKESEKEAFYRVQVELTKLEHPRNNLGHFIKKSRIIIP